MKKEFLVKGPISTDVISKHLASLSGLSNCGGHATFMGQVRNDLVDDKKVRAIEYSAYEALVSKEAERIISITESAFSDVEKIEILHSNGIVKAGEVSLFVLVAAGHRDQAFRACRHVVEMIKVHYPVWKKEIFEDESHRWKENP